MVYTPEVMKIIHIFSIFLFGPLLIIVGMMGKKTPPFFFISMMLMGAVVILFHVVTLYQEMLENDNKTN